MFGCSLHCTSQYFSLLKLKAALQQFVAGVMRFWTLVSVCTEPHNDKAGPQVADKGDGLQIWRWDANV